jgi:hypothetical protein
LPGSILQGAIEFEVEWEREGGSDEGAAIDGWELIASDIPGVSDGALSEGDGLLCGL